MIHPDHISRRFKEPIVEAGLPPIRLHDLRHGAATLALAGGADIKTVQAMLRHSTIALTANTYTWVLPKSPATPLKPPRPSCRGTDDGCAGPIDRATAARPRHEPT